MDKKVEIPQTVKDAVLDETEKILFPKPAKTTGGIIARILFSIGRIFVSKKKIDL